MWSKTYKIKRLLFIIYIFSSFSTLNSQCVPDSAFTNSPLGIYCADSIEIGNYSSISLTIALGDPTNSYDSLVIPSITLPTGINSSCSTGCTLLSYNNLFCLELQVVDSFNINDTITIDISNSTAWTNFFITPFPFPVTFSPYNLNLYCIGHSGLNNITACNTYTWIDGITYTASNNTATHTLSNIIGCDSVVNLDLIINNNSSSATDVITACDSLTWIDGVTYLTSNNTATYTLTNTVGCDSLVTIDLIINNSSSATDVITASDSLIWIDGVTYSTSNNTATYTLTNAVGCDSLVTIDLIINNSSSGNDVQTARNSITWIDGALIFLILMTLLPLI